MTRLDPPTPQDMQRMMANIEYTGELVDANDVLPPPGAPVKVVRSVRLPFSVSERVDSAAAQRGITPSELIRELIERGLAEPSGSDLVSPIEALAAISEALERLPRKSQAA